jgi:hypothetical protein
MTTTKIKNTTKRARKGRVCPTFRAAVKASKDRCRCGTLVRDHAIEPGRFGGRVVCETNLENRLRNARENLAWCQAHKDEAGAKHWAAATLETALANS